jgi:hypothetical protein
MKASTRLRSAVAATLASLLVLLIPPVIAAEQESSCLTCHLCGPMLVKNRGVATLIVSAMQSGAG